MRPGVGSKMLRYLILIFLLLPVAASPALSQGEHSRRVAAELRVMLGDARALTGSPAPSQKHQRGLNDRLRGGLSALGILMRLADEEKGGPTQNTRSILDGLRASLDQKNVSEVIEKLSRLSTRYPLAATGILPAAATPRRLKKAKEIHESFCAVCHDEPDGDVERPAYNLFTQSKAASGEEFLARMIIGVRGDRMTGLGNPLADEEIAALISYYRSARQ